jgi:hypothetical protein
MCHVMLLTVVYRYELSPSKEYRRYFFFKLFSVIYSFYVWLSPQDWKARVRD